MTGLTVLIINHASYQQSKNVQFLKRKHNLRSMDSGRFGLTTDQKLLKCEVYNVFGLNKSSCMCLVFISPHNVLKN